MDSSNAPLSKRERTTRLGMWLVVVLASEGFVIALIALLLAANGVDVGPAVGALSSVITLLMSAVAILGTHSAGYQTADTLRPSGSGWTGVKGATPPPSPPPAAG